MHVQHKFPKIRKDSNILHVLEYIKQKKKSLVFDSFEITLTNNANHIDSNKTLQIVLHITSFT